MNTWELRIAAAGADSVTLHVDQALLAALSIESIRPEPVASRLGPDGAAFIFAAEPGREGQVFVSLRPERYGLIRGNIAVNGSAPLPIRFFIWP